MAWPRFTLLSLQALLIVSLHSQSRSQDLSEGAFDWTLRWRTDLASRFEERRWEAKRTAFIVCDMWDYHHSVNAVRRLKEFAPRLNAVLAEARRRGATIIHAPSDCMPFYSDHPARKRALAVPGAGTAPEGVARWCHRIPGEESATYPIDQSNGGEDDDLTEHAHWAAHLKSIGRHPGTPWQRQTALLTIDADVDYIAPEGDVVWNLLESRQIAQVVLTGVHANMCVLGRPFGLRQMKRGGKQVLLMRDMTDVMYEPNSWPYVSHFTGMDLVIEHIEKYICPTVTSDQVIGGKPFRFSHDRRSNVAILWLPGMLGGEREAERMTKKTEFLRDQLQRDFQVSIVSRAGPDLDFAELLVIPSSRFASAAIGGFAARGRPIVGEPVSAQPLPRRKNSATGSGTHAIVKGAAGDGIGRLDPTTFPAYEADSAEVLLGSREAPAAWVSVRPDAGRQFCVMPGDNARLLFNACYWAVGRPIPDDFFDLPGRDMTKRWVSKTVPGDVGQLAEGAVPSWWRSLVLLPEEWRGQELRLQLGCFGRQAQVHLNGERVTGGRVPSAILKPGALNTVAVRLTGHPQAQASRDPADASLTNGEGKTIPLHGRWQARLGDDPAWARFPIPPQFGASTDFIFERVAE